MSQAGGASFHSTVKPTGSLHHHSSNQLKTKPAMTRAGEKSTEDISSSMMSTTEHSFLTDVAEVRQMEQGLLQLLDDFHQGKLQAFGLDCTFEKMDSVRERQERLARVHFDLESHLAIKGEAESAEAREAANKHLNKLMDNLQDLCSSIQNLQKDHPASLTTPSGS